jgi:hypothetical protein
VETRYPVARLVAEVGDDTSRRWWALCVERLGPGPIDRAIGLFRGAKRADAIINPGGLRTKILKDLAGEAGINLLADRVVTRNPQHHPR